VSSDSGSQRRRGAEEEDRRRPSAGGGEIRFASAVGGNKKCVSNSSTVEDANEVMHVPFCLALLKSP
jgi:hypothetical protein